MAAATPVILDFSQRKRGLPFIEFVFTIVACLFYSNIIVQSMYPYQMVVLFTIYVVYCYFKEPRYRKLIITFMLMLFLFTLLYLLLTDTSSINANVSNRTVKRLFSKYSQYLFMFIPVFMFYRIATQATHKQVYLLLGTIIVDFILLTNTAMEAVRLNQNILHGMSSVQETGESDLAMAAYYFVYAYTFVILAGIILFRNARSELVRIISLVIALFSIYFLFVAQFALSVVTCFVSILYLYFITTKGTSQRVFVIIGLLVILGLLPLLLSFIIDVLPENILRDRILEIYSMITGDSMSHEGDGEYRLNLYWMCIKAFLSSPLIGNRTLPEDGHATFLTVPADIGIYGLIFLYVIFKKANHIITGVLGEKKLYFKPLYFQIILMGLTNPIHSSPANFIQLFFMCPLLIMLFIGDNNKIKITK